MNDEALEVNYTKTRRIAFFISFLFTRCACAVEKGKQKCPRDFCCKMPFFFVNSITPPFYISPPILFCTKLTSIHPLKYTSNNNFTDFIAPSTRGFKELVEKLNWSSFPFFR